MPKISDEKRAARRSQILEAAWTCFQRQGLQATTMDDIIRAADLSAGAVYSYFPSKDDLIIAAVTASLSSLRNLVAPLLVAASAPSDLILSLMTLIERFTQREGYDLKRIALLGWAEAQRNEPLRSTMRSFYVEFREQLAVAVARWQQGRPGDAEEMAQHIAKVLLSLVFGFVVQAAVIGDVELEDMAQGMVLLGFQTIPAP